jgi:major membrane immunogen (membrane-anchored lipoprotein)
VNRNWWHPLLYIVATIALAVAAAVLLTGCGPADQASPTTISNGSTTITKAMRGTWKSDGGRNCRWWIESTTGTTLHNGNLIARQKKLDYAYQSQLVIINTGQVGGKFKSDKCGKGWHR